MAVFRASRVLLLHNVPFQMQITTADQPLTKSFSLFCRDFFVLPWQLWATVLLSVMQNLGIVDPAYRFKRIWNQKDKARFAGYLIIIVFTWWGVTSMSCKFLFPTCSLILIMRIFFFQELVAQKRCLLFRVWMNFNDINFTGGGGWGGGNEEWWARNAEN